MIFPLDSIFLHVTEPMIFPLDSIFLHVTSSICAKTAKYVRSSSSVTPSGKSLIKYRVVMSLFLPSSLPPSLPPLLPPLQPEALELAGQPLPQAPQPALFPGSPL